MTSPHDKNLVPRVVGAEGDAGMQIQFGREYKQNEADGGPPVICQGHHWQNSSPLPQCNQRNSWDFESVATDQSNHCGQRPWNSNDTNESSNDDDNSSRDAYDADNARRYADNAAKAKAESDKDVSGALQK